MKIIVSAREVMDAWAWEEACKMLGINEWAVNEGLMDPDEPLEFTEEQAIELGLIKQ